MKNIEACPFCGSEKIASIISSTGKSYIVGCASCEATVQALTEDCSIKTWNTRHKFPETWETVEQWEKRTGKTYPDDGPIYVWTVNNPTCLKRWRLMEYNYAKLYKDVCPLIIANHLGKPPADWRPQK